MPWTPKDSTRFTKKAKSPKSRRQWSKVADSMLSRTGDEGAAIRAANSVVKKRSAKSSAKSSHSRTRKRS
jgi:hypothetical protein